MSACTACATELTAGVRSCFASGAPASTGGISRGGDLRTPYLGSARATYGRLRAARRRHDPDRAASSVVTES